jgi:hypothetical protein
MDTKKRLSPCAALLCACLIPALFSFAGCELQDWSRELLHGELEDGEDVGPLAGKTFTVAASAAAATGATDFHWDGTTLTVAGKPYTAMSPEWAAYAVLGDFYYLSGVQATDTITFNNSGKISKLNKVQATLPSVIVIKLGFSGVAGEIAATAFASELTLTGIAGAGFRLGSSFLVPAGGKLTLAASTALNLNWNTLVNNGSLVLAASTELNLGGSTLVNNGSLVLTAGTVTTGGVYGSAAKITGTGKVKVGKTEISPTTSGTGGWEAVHASGTADDLLTITALTANTASITATGTNKPVLTASNTTAKITQLAGAGNNLDIAADTVVDSTEGSFILTADVAPNGAKFTGAGKLIVAKTEIIGGTGGWQAVGTVAAETFTIDSTAATASRIRGSATTAELTAGAGASITLAAGGSNIFMTLGANTTINLQGVAAATVGSIVLKGDTNPLNGGRISFATTSIIKTGNTDGGVAAGVIKDTGTTGGTTVIADLTSTGTGGGGGPGTGAVKATGTGTPAGTAGKLVQMSGASDDIVTATASTDVTLDSDTTATVY